MSIRHTKIVATLGPSSSGPDVLADLLRAGVDVFRLNFSHGTHESHAATYHAVREAAAAAGRTVAIMQDLSGPKIRTGALEAGKPITLKDGDTLRILAGEGIGGGDRVYTPYAPLVASARPGDRLLLDDGRIELVVAATAPGELVTTVVNGGTLGANKGINAPGVALPPSAITEKDEADLRFGLELGVDLVALSFVQRAEDIERARSVMQAAGRTVPIIAKIERPAAVDNFDEILAAASGIMVARGDLGLEMPLEQVPRVQKQIIRRCRTAGVPVILATQVLESMRTEPRPTRAEVSDAAAAVDQGADAIMLAGETAAGAYPVRAVRTLHDVIVDAERVLPAERSVVPVDAGSSHGAALCKAAVALASTGQADAIVAVTREGRTARLLASLRPAMPVFAATPSHDVAAWSALLWGITPVLVPAEDMDRSLAPRSMLDALERLLIARGILRTGSVVVFVNVSAELTRTDANFVNLQRLG